MRRPIPVIAAALLLQLPLTGVGHAVDATVDQTVEASTQRGVRVAGQEVDKITDPRVKVAFDVDPNLIGVSVEEYNGLNANPDDPGCPAEHDPLEDGTANMTVVADLQADATGSLTILVEYTETHADGSVHQHQALSDSASIGPVGPAGEVHRVPLCIWE